MKAWETVCRLKENDATLEGKVIATNRYGLRIYVLVSNAFFYSTIYVYIHSCNSSTTTTT